MKMMRKLLKFFNWRSQKVNLNNEEELKKFLFFIIK